METNHRNTGSFGKDSACHPDSRIGLVKLISKKILESGEKTWSLSPGHGREAGSACGNAVAVGVVCHPNAAGSRVAAVRWFCRCTAINPFQKTRNPVNENANVLLLSPEYMYIT